MARFNYNANPHPKVKCDCCTIGIGVTYYPSSKDPNKMEPFKHMYSKAEYITYKGKKIVLDEDCKRKIENNKNLLEDLYFKLSNGFNYSNEED